MPFLANRAGEPTPRDDLPAAPGETWPVDDQQPLIGYLAMWRKLRSNADASALAAGLLDRAKRNVNAADSLMDLSWVLLATGHREMAASTEELALKLRQLYRLPAASGPVGVRLLALMAPGDYFANTPLDYLIEGSDVALDLLFVGPALPFPDSLPDHDVLFVAVCESDQNLPLLRQIGALLTRHPGPTINAPGRIPFLARDRASALLRGAPGVAMPISVRVDRSALAQVGRQERSLASIIEEGVYPVIVRPVGSHMGADLWKLDDAEAVTRYLHAISGREFYAARFVDYRSADGFFRKYRIALIDDSPFACHLAISETWMVNYMNAQMGQSAAKRNEEAQFMATFDQDFACRHAEALAAIHHRLQLDYVVIDCGETPDRRLLIFEVDSAAIIHATDPVELFPYKQPTMRKAFDAFRRMLASAMQRDPTRTQAG